MLSKAHQKRSPQIQPFSFQHGLSFGQKATVACALNEGSLPLTFKWKKNGEELENSENVRVRDVEDVSILVINSLTQDSAGNYTCIVSNALGKDESTASLTIIAPVYASCQSPSVCIPIIRCLSHRSDPNWQRTGVTCGPGVFALRQICCLGPTLPPRLSRPSKELNCGKSLVSNPLMPIDNDGTSQDGAWPWVVNIDTSFEGSRFMRHCTGTLIDQKHVLVTGYCLFDFYFYIDSNLTYRVSVPSKLFKEDEVYTVKEYVIHPLYDFGKFSGNIAILKLHEKIVNPDVHPICLQNEELLSTNISRSYATLAGIHDEVIMMPVSMNNRMHFSHMSIISNSQCYEAYNGTSSASDMKTEDIVCAVLRKDYKYSYKNRIDTGGALMIRRGEQWFLVGIYTFFLSSFEDDVDIRRPLVFLRISSYFDWIKLVLEN